MWGKTKKIENEFLWKPLKPKYQDALMSKNFVIRESIDDGSNGLIDCLEIALQSDNIKIEAKYIKKNFGKFIKGLKFEKFAEIMGLYMKSHQDGFKRDWHPASIERKKELAHLIKQDVFFIGNDLETLYLMSMYLGVEFVVFDDRFKAKKIGDHPSIIYLMYDSKKQKYNIIGLKYYKKDKIITKAIFHKKDLPNDLKVIRNIRAYLLENAKKVFFKAIENKEKISMDELIDRVDNNVYLELDDNVRKQLKQLMKSWLTK